MRLPATRPRVRGLTGREATDGVRDTANRKRIDRLPCDARGPSQYVQQPILYLVRSNGATNYCFRISNSAPR